MSWIDLRFTDLPAQTGKHHESAAAANAAVVDEAVATLLTALASPTAEDGITHILLRAAAGAGKSFALRELILAAANAGRAKRIGVTAFTNNQIRPLAEKLTEKLGRDQVCLHLSQNAVDALPDGFESKVRITTTASDIPETCRVLVSTAHKFRAPGERGRIATAVGADEQIHLFDVLFVDEAWQMPHHLFDAISGLAPIIVGVGDVGQLPPLEIGDNPWRGDSGHNPYRAWPIAFQGRTTTWERELPTVWRPAGEALGLWRAFYPEWSELNSVAAPRDRRVVLNGAPTSAPLWQQVGSGEPTLVEVDGLPESEAPDVDLPLTQALEEWLDELFTAGFSVEGTHFGAGGIATDETERDAPGTSDEGDPLVVLLATRNQAVDDLNAVVDRLRAKHDLRSRDLQASTVDSWQGRTNAITIAFHPLTGATELDDFNSAFGRLAVTCTRATHGLLVLSRSGLDDLLDTAPARPGTPFGEPGYRQLPRQTHQRILRSFARGRIDVSDQLDQEV